MTNEAFDHIAKEKLQNYTATVPAGLWEKIRLPNISNPVDPFDAFLKDKLSNTSVAVPEDMWSRIKPEEEDRKRFFFMMPRATMVAASLLLLIITGSVSAYLYYQKFQLPQKNSNTESLQPSSKGSSNSTLSEQPNHINNNNTKTPITPADATTKEESSTEDKLTATPLEESVESNTNIVNVDASKRNSLTSEIKKTSSNKLSATLKYKNIQPLVLSNSKENLGNRQLNLSSNKVLEFESVNNDHFDELAYQPTAKFDASFLKQQKNYLLYKSVEKEIAFKNHAGTIKNVVICPSDKKLRNPNWDLEMYASPDYAFKTISNNNASQQFMDRKDSSESARIGFSTGFRIVKPINDHLSIKTGFNYSQVNEAFTYRTENELKTTTVITVRNITLANGTTVTVSDTSILQQLGFKTNTVKNRYKSIDVPILLGYQFGNDDLSIGINAGLIINLNAWYQGVILDTSLTATPITKDNNVIYKNNIGLGIYTGIQIAKRINYNTSIFAEPYIRYNLSNMTTPQSLYNQRMTIGGLAIGLKFNLNNR